MLRVGMPSQNKLSKFRVLKRVAFDAKNLNVCWVCTKCRGRAVRFGMMTLKIFKGATFFAASTFRHNLRNCFSAGVRSVTNATLPFWVAFFSHATSSCGGHTRDTAIFPSTAAPFANLKLLAAFFASTLQQSFWLSRAQFLRTLFRTSMRQAPNVRIWPRKDFFTSSAYQRGVPTPLNHSLEFCHG